MKRQLNEIRKFQKIAGILTEEDTPDDAARQEDLENILANMKIEVEQLLKMQYSTTAKGALDRVYDEYLSKQEFDVPDIPDTEDFPFESRGGVVKKTGLYVIGATKEDNIKVGEMADEKGLYGEWNAREGYWFFPEDVEMYDELEKDIQRGLDKHNINARIEGIF